MSIILNKPAARAALGLAGLALGAALASVGPVAAADLEEAYLAPPSPPRVRYEVALPPPPPKVRYEVALPPPPPRLAVRHAPVAVVEGAETCRVFTKARLDPYGREVLHRVRVCDEGPLPRPRRVWAGPASVQDYLPPRAVPVPPRPVPLAPAELYPDLDGDLG